MLLTCGHIFITLIFSACDKTDDLETVVQTYAGSGITWSTVPNNGIGMIANFNAPTQLSIHDHAGSTVLYVVDGNHFIRMIDQNRNVSTLDRESVYFSDNQLWSTYSIFDVYIDPADFLTISCAEFDSDQNHSTIAFLHKDENQVGLTYDGLLEQNHLWSFTRNDASDIVAGTRMGTVLKFETGSDTLAGSTRGYADGAGNSAKFGTIYDIVSDHEGNLYIADGDNHCIRKVSDLGEVTTYAGTNEAGFNDGIGSGARFSNPRALAIDKNGILYVADTGNHAIRRINLEGGVSTIAGGIAGFENGPVESARFNSPEGIALDDVGRIFVADRGNNVVRVIARENISSD